MLAYMQDICLLSGPTFRISGRHGFQAKKESDFSLAQSFQVRELQRAKVIPLSRKHFLGSCLA